MPTSQGKSARAHRSSSASPKLKNYRAESPIATILETIRRTLVENGAKRISFDYDDAGQASCIHFTLQVQGQILTFRLPARLQNVEGPLIESYRVAGRTPPRGEALQAQVYRTAWATIRDWLAAQMTLIRIHMAKAEEVFLPYLLNSNNQTYFEVFEQRLMLPAPGEKPAGSITINEV